jgi:hypothetical protein
LEERSGIFSFPAPSFQLVVVDVSWGGGAFLSRSRATSECASETRLGLAPASFAEQAAAANQARAMAQHYAALGGGESFSNKRVNEAE